MEIQSLIKAAIRDVPDFPKPGILFKDITPIMMNPNLSKRILEYLVEYYREMNLDVVAGVESRGFLFGYPLAMELGLPFVLIRKKGKLPYDKVSYEYDLEYGSATIEVHTDAIEKGQRVLIHDDLLATGGSAAAAAALIESIGGEIAGFNFLVYLEFLEGQKKLEQFSDNILNLATY